ncbi:Putative class I glutamine amidotransferase [Septoria linicola]|uniref:Class I glutamine amidotransferase n=1 Tax=Septoria linicola TaxID=215465 RepID=A0A9Q9EQ07_9PEZI|nr:putative class I glutamine amidotransferase [Septoria linicola]USW59326.1 Putative class I glutamine amidotransferase [Septoria linicola]
MLSETEPKFKILILAFQGLNILDLTGPAEGFGNSAIRPTFEITTAASSDLVTSAEGIAIKPDRFFHSLLDPAYGRPFLSDYDLLVVPGGPPPRVQEAIYTDEGLLNVIRAFAAIKRDEAPNDDSDPWLRSPIPSICTGAGFIGAVGLLGGRTVTTHFAYIPRLGEICKAAGSEATVVRKRFVNAGKTENGMMIMTAGGVSCGIDAALWISSKFVSLEKTKEVATSMDYEWKFGKNEFTQEWIV